MFRETYLTILFCATCLALPMFNSHLTKDNDEMENIRVKRYGFLGGYNPYLNNSPYTYKFKTPLFKVKIKSGGYQNDFSGHQPYGFGGTGFYPSYGGSAFHPPLNLPYGYHYNPHGYGWYG
ncbi:prismalin-14 [Loa loa]|uniref:Prismalin-14 n=1 Tax=Loa loa TaxID=7209 RepID=A0A1I7VWC0_LOALO|nr:prismalin-14 [Loa loa]EFO16587.1 prismalin-14 [Loa loa]